MPAPKTAKRGKVWQDVVYEARALRDQTLAEVGVTIALPPRLPTNITNIPEEILSEENVRITSLAPQQLVDLISNNKLSAREVIQAFLERAVAAQKLVSQLNNVSSANQPSIAYQFTDIDKLPN